MEACEQVGGYAAVGYHTAYGGDPVQIPFPGVLAVHGLEHAVASGLYREVYVVADVRVACYGGYGVVAHVLGMRCGEAYPHVGGGFGHGGQKGWESDVAAPV